MISNCPHFAGVLNFTPLSTRINEIDKIRHVAPTTVKEVPAQNDGNYSCTLCNCHFRFALLSWQIVILFYIFQVQ